MPRTAQEVVTEVEKEVVRDRDVDDPSVALHIQWAQDDIAHLREALETDGGLRRSSPSPSCSHTMLGYGGIYEYHQCWGAG